jgi:glycosyltransferase involved in cell wall biosynthesis
MASGRPVIAFAKGGALETVVSGRTGLFFHEQTTEAMMEAIGRFEATAHTFDPVVLQAHARSFGMSVFKERLGGLIDSLIAARPGTPTGSAAAG